MSILLGIVGYCLATYVAYWFTILRGTSGAGCGLDTLARVMMVFAPIFIPYYLVKRLFSR